MSKNVYYILIDTCSWRQLVSKTQYSKELTQLLYWQNAGDIIILAQEVVMKEWVKHGLEEEKRIDVALRNSESVDRALVLLNATPEDRGLRLDYADRMLKKQVADISELLRSAKFIPTSSGATYLAHQHKENKIAPYHLKADSDKDALMIFSTLEHCKKEGIQSLIFISSNTNEFLLKGAPGSVLHPGIQEPFKEVHVKYFVNAFDAIEALKVEGLKEYKVARHEDKKIKELLRVNKSNPVQDQMLEYFQKRFSEFDYLPKNVFADHYPFVIKRNGPLEKSPFTLTTDNEAVIKYFLEPPANGKEQEMILQVLKCNLIDHVSKAGNFRHYPISFPDKMIVQEKLSDDFLAMRFDEVFERLKVTPVTLKEQMQHGYVLYKLGDFERAVVVFEDIVEKAKADNAFLTAYAANYNLKKLVFYLQDYGYSIEKVEVLISRLEDIDLANEKELSFKEVDEKIYFFFPSEEFINRALRRVYQMVGFIRDQYNRRSKGFTKYLLELRNYYYDVERFCNCNGIVFDQQYSFEELTDVYIEGLFLSYASDGRMDGQLLYFNDDDLFRMLNYADAEQIQKFFNRYKLPLLKMQEGSLWPDAACHYLDSMLYRQATGPGGEKLHSTFREHMERLIHNCITIAAILDVGEEQVNRFATSILSLLYTYDDIKGIRFKQRLQFFLAHHVPKFTDEKLIDFIRFVYGFDRNFLEYLAEPVIEECLHRGIVFEMDEEKFNRVIHNWEESKQADNDDESDYVLIMLHRVIKEKYQKIAIENCLTIQLLENYDPRTFYLAVIHGMDGFFAQFSPCMFSEIRDIVNELAGRDSVRLGDDPNWHIRKIDEYLNVCFMYNIPVHEDIRWSIVQFSAYYKWLMDLDNYDYAICFNVDWLTYHYTLHYKRYFRKSMKLNEVLTERLRERFDDRTASFCINTFCRED